MARKAYDGARDFLESVSESRINVERARRRLQSLRDQTEQITAQIRDTPCGGSQDMHKDAALVALADQRDALLRGVVESVDNVKAVESFIRELPSRRCRIILNLRYVDCLGWKQVLARLYDEGLYYSERQIFRLHGEALQEARRLWQTKCEEGTHEYSRSAE